MSSNELVQMQKSQATGGDFRTGAITAGANEALINQLMVW